MHYIHIQGASTHNLKNLTLDIPRDRFVVITGPSGSGKSSLAFDTLYAEGQRQYIESLSISARQFIDQLERPEVEMVEGLQPTVSIDQRRATGNPRSTVATATEIYDYLRLLFARLGLAHCHRCGRAIEQQSPERVLEIVLGLPEGTRLMIMAPLVRGRRGGHQETLDAIRRAGFVRARVDGVVYPLEDVPPLDRQKTHSIEAVVDRIILRPGIESRLAESLKLALKHGEGLVVACYEEPTSDGRRGPWVDRLFSTKYACADCEISYTELEPRTFSFNSPYGVCTACQGLGRREQFDPELVAPDLRRSLSTDAITAWKGASSTSFRMYQEVVSAFLHAAGLRWNTPLEKYPEETLHAFFHGDRDDGFPGILALLEREYEGTRSKKNRERLEAFRADVCCVECGGSRLRAEARGVEVGGKRIHEVTALTISAARHFFQEELTFNDEQQSIAGPLVRDISARIEFLERVGLEYLTLDRPTDTLSGGELQRVRLATGLGSGLVGVCYILDEPSIGLHPRDNDRLIRAMRDLQSQGNTLIVVEHDEAVARQADWLIDMGPGAGEHGGEVVVAGAPSVVAEHDQSLTGRYLRGELQIPVPPTRRRTAKTRTIVIEGVTTNNLKDITVPFPLSVFTCVTGVSGSGKSSLLNETLCRALARKLHNAGPKPGPHRSLRGASRIDKIIQIDQSPIGRSPRSSPATYTGVFDEIRKVFARTKDAKRRGFGAGRFSFNVPGGRCETCQGRGQQKIRMNFLPDLHVTCPDCGGRRFNRATLDIRYREKSIADVLAMRVDEAERFFENFATIARLIGSLGEVGLGYLTLGQASTTLSGGEAQRVKLATELARVETGNTLYLLDEPTTGLHANDIKKLLEVLSRLVDLGNTVIVIEHNIDVMKMADWIIDLGPEGGERGGHVVATGTPEEIAALQDNHTARFLREALRG